MTKYLNNLEKEVSPELTPRYKSSAELERVYRNKNCRRCPLSDNKKVKNVCTWGYGPVPASGMIVVENPSEIDDERGKPIVNRAGAYIRRLFAAAGLDFDKCYVTSAVKCHAEYDQDALRKNAEHCYMYLNYEIEAVQPVAVLALGAVPYHYFTNKFGTLTSRGGAFQYDQSWIIPSLDLDYVLTYPQYEELLFADIMRFKRFLAGRTDNPHVHLINVETIEDFREMMDEIGNPEEGERILTFDIETRGFVDGKEGFSRVWCAAFTRGRVDEEGIRTFVVPLEHPESPFMTPGGWDNQNPGILDQEVAEGVVQLLRDNRVNGHNIKFDIRHIRQFAKRYNINWENMSDE